MKLKNYFFVVFMTLLLVLPNMALSASAPKKPVTAAEVALYKGADRQQVLEEGAKKEGRLTFYTAPTPNPVVDAFQKKYPYIKVDVWRAGTTEMVPRVQEEFSAGKYTADVIELTQAGVVMMREASLLLPFYSSELANVEEGAVIKGPAGAFAAGHYQSGIGLGYNTKLLKKDEVPKTYQDLLNPKWKGKMALAGSNTGDSWVGGALETYGEGFIEKLAGQKIAVHQVSGRALLNMIISGEILMSPTIFDSHVNKSKQDGAPCDWVPLEPVTSFLGQIMLPKNNPHPYAAMLFIDFDLSRQAGQLYVASGYNSPRKDIEVERNYKKYYGPFSTKQVQKWSGIFQKYFLTP